MSEVPSIPKFAAARSSSGGGGGGGGICLFRRGSAEAMVFWRVIGISFRASSNQSTSAVRLLEPYRPTKESRIFFCQYHNILYCCSQLNSSPSKQFQTEFDSNLVVLMIEIGQLQ